MLNKIITYNITKQTLELMSQSTRSELYKQAKALNWPHKWNKSKTNDMKNFIQEQEQKYIDQIENIKINEKVFSNNIIPDRKMISEEIKLIEKFNPLKLQWILTNKDNVKKQLIKKGRWSDNWTPWKQLEKYYNLSGKKQVIYTQRNEGRVFAQGAQGLQSIAREFRHTIAQGYYQDLDMVNAHPSILQYLCRLDKISTPYLDEYVADREGIISEIGDRDTVKTLILKLTNGGGSPSDNKWVQGYADEMTMIHSKFAEIRKVEFEEYSKGKDQYNIKAKFMNILLCRYEHLLLMEIFEYFGKPEDAVLCFDGIMLNKSIEIDTGKIEKHITDKYGIRMKLKIKPMTEGFDTTSKPTSLRIFSGFSTEVFNSKYCSDYKPLMDTLRKCEDVALVANMGTGKTVAAAKHAKSLKGTAGVLSFRISLAQKYKDDFPKFKCYKDLDDKIIDCPKWICQLDSLHRIKTPWVDTLYIDEVSQVRRHLSADTFIRNKNYIQNVDALKSLILRSNQLVIMDANMTPADLKWIIGIRNKIPKIYINEATPRKQTIAIVRDEQEIIRLAREDLSQGRKFIIAHNGGKKHHEPLRRMFKGKILLINSDTIADDEVKAALANPNETWGSYDGVIYSPSVQSGVSYDKVGIFHSIYGIFSNCTNSSGDACQMLNRVRHPINKTIRVSIDKKVSVQSRTVRGLLDIIASLRSHLAFNQDEEVPTSCMFNDYNETDFIESKLNNDLAWANVEQNLDRLNYDINFIYHQERYGNEVILSKDPVNNLIEFMEIGTEKCRHGDEVAEEKAQELADAVNINEGEADTIKKKLQENKQTTKGEVNSLKKFNLNKFYKMTDPQENKNWYLIYTNDKIKQQYRNSSKYFNTKSFQENLEDLKTEEIRRDRYKRIGHQDEVDLRECIIDFWTHKPRYQKEKVLINWVEDMGFDSLDSKVELTKEELKNRLTQVIAKIDKHVFDVLGKDIRKLNTLKELDSKDSKFMKKGLEFINGSLSSYFGVSIGKKTKNNKDSGYVLVNKNIRKRIFRTREGPPSIPKLGEEDIQDPQLTEDDFKGAIERLGINM
jgi:hypothetical protein